MRVTGESARDLVESVGRGKWTLYCEGMEKEGNGNGAYGGNGME